MTASLQHRLSLALAAAIVAVGAVAGGFSFASALDEAHEQQDTTLEQIARSLGPLPSPAPTLAPSATHDTDDEARVVVQALGPARSAGGLAPALPLPQDLREGLHTLTVGGAEYRVLARTQPDGRRVAVAQRTAVRDELARDGALRTVAPFLLLMPLLLPIVAALIRRTFRPVTALSAAVDRRSEQDLGALPDSSLAPEVRGFVLAINRLLARVQGTLDAQQRFIADAAHELRSPLTALSLQAERLAEAPMSDAARLHLAVLRQGVRRNRQLVDQLLSLAAAHAGATAPAEPVDVEAILRQVLQDLMPLVQAKHLDLDVETSGELGIVASELDLLAVVRNLVDNAVRYAPPKGRVELKSIRQGPELLLQVRDSGPGIPAAERTRVLDPFYRVLGTGEAGAGLGLSIVDTVVRRLHGDLRLEAADALTQTGLCVTVRLPLRPPCLP